MSAPDPQHTLKGLQLLQEAQRLQQGGQLAPAANAYRQAMQLLPTHPGVVAAYATLAEQVQDWSAAEKLYRRLGELRPDSGFESRLGLALFRQERFSECVPLFRTHLARQPDDADVRRALGFIFCRLKQWEEALECGRHLERSAPDARSMDLVLNSLFNLGRGEELDALVDTAVVRHPDSPDVLSLCGVHLLKRSLFARGFAYQRAIRWRYDKLRPEWHEKIPADWWDGKPFAGTLLIAGEQGLGEEILSSCMLRDIVAMNQPASVECEPRLIPLFRRSFPQVEFLPRWEGHFDRRIADGISYRRIKGLDLAYFLRRSDPMPPQAPWLVPDAERVAGLRAAYRERFPGKRLVGISWRSHRAFKEGPDKSVPPAALAPLLAREDCAFIDLQYGDVTADLAILGTAGMRLPWRDPQIDSTNDLDGLAAQLSALDELVSVSNSTTHIAGALGVPTLLLLPKSRPVFWYWGYDAERTPWYPSLRLRRNDDENDWLAFMQRIAGEMDRPGTPT
ncbi:MAG: hypothetical protein ACOY33_05035 [Pseudomonadota bacterium]